MYILLETPQMYCASTSGGGFVASSGFSSFRIVARTHRSFLSFTDYVFNSVLYQSQEFLFPLQNLYYSIQFFNYVLYTLKSLQILTRLNHQSSILFSRRSMCKCASTYGKSHI